jgi:bis(5'-nucleosyl)-tetraphosphatase (symmetrical)
MILLVGDVQGCDAALGQLLAQTGFSPSRDQLVLLGDLVNRGPASLDVLRRVAGLGAAAHGVLGNHDLHLLAVAAGVRRPHRSDTLGEILDDPQREHWLHWMRQQRLALNIEGWLCLHAGVLPGWDVARTLELAAEVETLLRGPGLAEFLPQMYGNEPDSWSDDLQGASRWRVIVNALTRLRFCDASGRMDFAVKEGADAAPAGMWPWFEVPDRRSAGAPIAFGHWSTLGLIDRADLLALDTGCVWGGCLTAARVDGGRRELIQVRCAAERQPGNEAHA